MLAQFRSGIADTILTQNTINLRNIYANLNIFNVNTAIYMQYQAVKLTIPVPVTLQISHKSTECRKKCTDLRKEGSSGLAANKLTDLSALVFLFIPASFSLLLIKKPSHLLSRQPGYLK